jgi:hypothetical protein
MKRMRNGLSIILRERQLGQKTEVKTQRLQFDKRRKIQRRLSMWL